MKRMYLFIFVGILAVVFIVLSIMNFDPAVETWTSLLGGAAIGFLIVSTPSIIAYYKKTKQKGAK